MNIYFGENLKSLREKRELTQANLAGFLGVSFQTISKWERGETYPDISYLPDIADFFGVTIDSLLGADRGENERKINEYITLFDTTYFTNTDKLIDKFEKAVTEFPSDFRILVRYMELMIEVKDHPFIKTNNSDDFMNASTNNPYKLGFEKNPEYEAISQKIQSIYEAIQNLCTDDDIRIRAKRLMIKHLMIRYDLSFDEKTEKWYCDTVSAEKAKEIADTLPAISDTKECNFLAINRDLSVFNTLLENALEELLFHLQDVLGSYILYTDNISAEYKIEKIKSIISLLNILESDDNISKNEINLMLDYCRLSSLNSQIDNTDEALYYLEKCIDIAIKLDNHPDEMERIARFYSLERPLETGSMRGRMKKIITENYPFAEKFKANEKFKAAIENLNI